MSDAHQQSPEYQHGPVQGGAQKRRAIRGIRDLWSYLLLVLTLLYITTTSLYSSYTEYQIEREKVKACAHATDVTACITVVGK
jgi:hypothetical protein